MNVRELIQALRDVEDGDKIVKIEGCDCINPAEGVDLISLPGEVLITADLSSDWDLP